VELRGAAAVVTGASSGIGHATALALARQGASVVVAARRTELLDELVSEIEGHGGRAVAAACDVSKLDDVQALHARTIEAFGRCDVLVNNAGVAGGGPFETLSFEHLERLVRVNYLGVLYGSKVFLPSMLAAGRGHIVNVASLAGRFAVPGSAVYSSTKHAVVAFSESLYGEVKARGVLATAVNPAFVDTEGFPQRGRPKPLLLSLDRVSGAIVRVAREGIAPEYSIPRWAAAGQLFRILVPGLYHRGLARFGTAPRPEPDH
jgi:short-subunit dehydrogenase